MAKKKFIKLPVINDRVCLKGRKELGFGIIINIDDRNWTWINSEKLPKICHLYELEVIT
jgi:hypothetical protein